MDKTKVKFADLRPVKDDIFQEGPRGGTRGGRDKFNWELIKNDPQRENYIGSCIHAMNQRFHHKDVHWYTKDKATLSTDGGESLRKGKKMKRKKETEEDIRKEEIKKIKQQEEEMMAAALGNKATDKLIPITSTAGPSGQSKRKSRN
jgi:hypothetical protein